MDFPVIQHATEIQELHDRDGQPLDFLRCGYGGFNGIEYGYRVGDPGVWAYDPCGQGGFYFAADSVQQLVDFLESGKEPRTGNIIDNWTLVEPHWERVSIYDGPDVFLREFHKTPEVARNLLAVHWCIAEIENGGFHQFLTNSTGILAPEAEHGLRTVGLTDAAAILNRVMALLGDPYPRDREERGETVHQLFLLHPKGDDMFEDDDSQFYIAVDSAGAIRSRAGWAATLNRYATNSESPMT